MVHATVGIRARPPKTGQGCSRARIGRGWLSGQRLCARGLTGRRLGADGIAAQGSGKGGSGDQELPDARAAEVKCWLSSSVELEIDFGMVTHVASLSRSRARVAQKRYTFYSPFFKYCQEEPILDSTWSSRSILPSHGKSLCSRDISPHNHKILMSHLRKNFRHLQPKSTSTQAHAPSRKRGRCPLARAHA